MSDHVANLGFAGRQVLPVTAGQVQSGFLDRSEQLSEVLLRVNRGIGTFHTFERGGNLLGANVAQAAHTGGQSSTVLGARVGELQELVERAHRDFLNLVQMVVIHASQNLQQILLTVSAAVALQNLAYKSGRQRSLE